MYNYNHLYYFFIAAKAGGVTNAARQLKLSQPSLSTQLKTLEGVLNLKLFERVGRQNQLTSQGEMLLGFCRQIFEPAEHMKDFLAKKAPGSLRRIQIGVSDEIDVPFAVETVSAFLKTYKIGERPLVAMVSGNKDTLLRQLRFREIDAVVTEQHPVDPDTVDLESVESPVLLAFSRDAKIPKFHGKSHATARLLAALKSDGSPPQWVLPSAKFKLRSQIDQFLEQKPLQGRVVFESDVIASVVRSVIDGVGMSFLPKVYIGREMRENQVQVRGPADGFWKYRIWLVGSRAVQNDPAIAVLARCFKDVFSRVK